MLARVFPRRTKATPTDALAFVGEPPQSLPSGISEVHISVTFSWDKPAAAALMDPWSRVAPTRVGGPAFGEPAGEFTPGRYLAPGYVITSRGCPNSCWFCSAWKREGHAVRELPIRDGFNVLDDNLLACSRTHVEAVFAMLARQKNTRGRKQPAQFTGGLEAKRLLSWHAEALRKLSPEAMFFAYDEAADWEPLVEAARLLKNAGFVAQGAAPHRAMRCYVLIGGIGDTTAYAAKRLNETLSLGFTPMAMLWKPSSPEEHATMARHPRDEKAWLALATPWMRPARIHSMRRDHTAPTA